MYSRQNVLVTDLYGTVENGRSYARTASFVFVFPGGRSLEHSELFPVLEGDVTLVK